MESSPSLLQKTLFSRWALVFFLVCLGFVGGVYFGRAQWKDAASVASGVTSTDVATANVRGLKSLAPKTLPKEIDFSQFWQLWDELKQKYYQQPLSDEQLFYGAMQGLAQSTGDPYTTYFPPKEAEDFQTSLAGKFDGIGAEIGKRDGLLQIVAPLPETPAERAGLRAGDVIVKINGTDTTDFSVEQAVQRIRGVKGTPVTLTLYREHATTTTFEVRIVRDTIRVKSVRWHMTTSSVAVLDISAFNEDTDVLFRQAAQEILQKKPKGIIVDLRNDPGGFLETALRVAGAWVGDRVVVKERRQGEIGEELRGTMKPILASIPTIVLVNQGSASASEIVAGALQDYGSARLLGQTTFGKGSVQAYESLPDGSALKITIAEWLTPNGRAINKTGLKPDIVVDLTPEDYVSQRDPQLERALQILRGGGSSYSGR